MPAVCASRHRVLSWPLASLLAGLVLAGCHGQPPTPALQRLLPALGAPQQVRLRSQTPEEGEPRDQTRPAIALHPGERRAVELRVGGADRLRFALAAEHTPKAGGLVLEVTANRSVVFRRVVEAGPEARHWQPVAVPLRSAGDVRLEFRCLHTEGARSRWNKPPALLLGSPRVSAAGRRPGRVLIWISQDTLRADHLGAYGHGRSTSPHFDRLVAARGALFERAVAPAPWTLPALASQFTSRYPSFHGAVASGTVRDAHSPTLFEALAAQGFTVLGVSANRFVSPDFAMTSGFDTLWYTPRKAQDVTALARRLLEEWDGGDLALFVHYLDPHYEYEPPHPFDTLFDAGYTGRFRGRDFFEAKAAEDIEHVKAQYDGEIAFTDQQIGALLGTLEARGLLERAVVVYSADHGEEFREHRGWLHNATLYEEALHVPFALWIPGLPARRVAQVVSLVDLAPSVLEALGVARPASFQGRSLLPLLRGESLPEVPAYSETERTWKSVNRKLSVRKGHFKYILVMARGGDGPLPHVVGEEFYDLAADPGETRSLATSPEREPMRQLAQAYLLRARSEGSVPAAAELAPDVEEKLRALGYIQ